MSTTIAPSTKPLKRLSLLQSPTSLAFDASSAAASDALPSPASPAAQSVSNLNSKTTRRQSSIYYLPPGSVDGVVPESATLKQVRRYSALQSSAAATTSAFASERSKRQSASSVAEGPSPAALTLAEKHADLLRFIAQKESCCSELRAQLSTEEAELLLLKRKWERIVRRGFDTGSTSDVGSITAPTMAAGDGAALLSGLREGMQGVSRLLAQLSAGEQPAYAESNHVKDLGHASVSSVSTTQTQTSARLSQSSMSSVEEHEEDIPSTNKPDVVVEGKPVLRQLCTAQTTTRRRPYEPSSPQSASGLPPTPLSASTSPDPSHVSPISSQPDMTKPTLARGPSARSSAITTANVQCKRANRPPSLASISVSPPSGAFPTGVVSLPGAGAAAAWVGRRISARTSTLLSDALAALASPTTPSVPNVNTRPAPSPHLRAEVRTAKTGGSAAPSLLDDFNDSDRDAEFGEWTAALAPEKLPPSPATAPFAPSAKTDERILDKKDTDADSEEWNW